MIDWDQITEDHGFKTEVQMWKTLLVSLRNSEAIGKYLGVSRGAVQRRRQILNLHRVDRRGSTYRTASKRAVLGQVPDEIWTEPIEDIQMYIEEKFNENISRGYISKYRKQRGL